MSWIIWYYRYSKTLVTLDWRIMAEFTDESIEKIPFDCMCSFCTDNWIGIWNHNGGRYVMFQKEECEFFMITLPKCDNYIELAKAVYDNVNEFVTDIWEDSKYKFTLCNY